MHGLRTSTGWRQEPCNAWCDGNNHAMAVWSSESITDTVKMLEDFSGVSIMGIALIEDDPLPPERMARQLAPWMVSILRAYTVTFRDEGPEVPS